MTRLASDKVVIACGAMQVPLGAVVFMILLSDAGSQPQRVELV